jgi:hypothetical protein
VFVQWNSSINDVGLFTSVLYNVLNPTPYAINKDWDTSGNQIYLYVNVTAGGAIIAGFGNFDDGRTLGQHWEGISQAQTTRSPDSKMELGIGQGTFAGAVTPQTVTVVDERNSDIMVGISCSWRQGA